MDKYKFYKNGDEWFVDLPDYLEKGGSHADLQMVEGADEMLEIMSDGQKMIIVKIVNEIFDDADLLILKEKCELPKGGGIYFMKEFEGKKIDLTLWLCKVIEFVFGEIPAQLFVKREKQ